MDQAIQQFLQTGTLVLAFAVFIATFFVRRIVETAVPNLAKKTDKGNYSSKFAMWWNQVILYAIPVTIGALIGLMNIPFLFGDQIQTMGGRCFFGAVVGWFSSFMYKIFRRVLAKNVDVEEPGGLPE
jgi:hypothetical protein